MAGKKINRVGFGQVEPNHLSAQRTAQIYAQLPAAADISILENGQFVKYNRVDNVCDFSDEDYAGEWMMVFNEVKLYDDKWRETYKDFAMIKENYTPGEFYEITAPGVVSEDPSYADYYGMPHLRGQMVPRVVKINVGDSWTTNTLYKGNTSGKVALYTTAELATVDEIAEGDMLKISEEGFVVKGTDDAFQLVATEIYNLADGQDAVKITRIK